MKKLLVVLSLFCSFASQAQFTELKGRLVNEESASVPYATVTLMNPADSTLLYFAVSNTDGYWQIRNIKPGEYLFQVAFMGYNTINRKIMLPKDQNTVVLLQMTPKSYLLQGTDVTAEHIPVLIKGDTVEYNAGAFKTNPGDVAENLLEKLPGVEVDQNGNIKAMGEDVNTVLVDGKEFFGSDPKVATKNLPAEAIDKVQVYDKASEEEELTGIDDAGHDKTINIVLKDGQKQTWFGELAAGGGSGEHYSATAKVFRFTKTQQTAFLGMHNNINKAGFSLQEYISFNGGLSSLMNGGGLQIRSDENLPIDLGGPVNGLVRSGAGALNYFAELKPGRRLFGSYIGSGSVRDLDELVTTDYFLGNTTERSVSQNKEKTTDGAHRLNIGYKDRSDSSRVVLFNARAGFSENNSQSYMTLLNISGPLTVSSLEKYEENNGRRIYSGFDGSWMKKFDGRFRLLKMRMTGNFSAEPGNNEWNSLTTWFSPEFSSVAAQRFEENNNNSRYTFSATGLMHLNGKTYMEGSLEYAADNSISNRKQGVATEPFEPTDSLSEKYSVLYQSLIPGIAVKRNSKKLKTRLSVDAEAGRVQPERNDTSGNHGTYFYLQPSAGFEYEFKTGRRLSAMYYSDVNKPTAEQLSPRANRISPLMLWYGNTALKPEQRHNTSLMWMLFDQFSQISVFALLNGTVTLDKISFDRTIDDSLHQTIHLINCGTAHDLEGSLEFSTPVRKAGFNLSIEYKLAMNQSRNIINGLNNEQTNLMNTASIRFDKRKKEKLQIGTGAEISWTHASYSVQSSLNARYLNYNWFAELRWTPGKRWNISLNADITSYTADGFDKSLTIPLLNTSVAYSFLKFNRATLSVDAFDLLDQNKGIERVSEQNFLRETRSNTLGCFVMLTFRYRLNRSKPQEGIVIDTGR